MAGGSTRVSPDCSYRFVEAQVLDALHDAWLSGSTALLVEV